MAHWYDTMVGSKGHKFHQEYAIPEVMKLMNLKKGEAVLDIGCGQGALSYYVDRAGGKYTGIDSSPNLINSAKKRHAKEGFFYIDDAASLKQVSTPEFDYIVFLLSIQDMDPLDKIISQAAKKLKPKGKIIIFMMHPAFRIPRQSGWGEDKKRKLVYRRVDRYMSEDTIPLNTNVHKGGRSITSYYYHRPLYRYFEEFSKNGLRVDKLHEISENKRDYGEFPTFLALTAVKM